MGISAYNRGTAALSRQIQAEQPTGDEILFRDLTEQSQRAEGRLLPIDTGIRLGSDKRWWLMNRLDGGWAEYGIPFDGLRQIAAAYRLAFFGWSSDQYGRYIAVTSY